MNFLYTRECTENVMKLKYQSINSITGDETIPTKGMLEVVLDRAAKVTYFSVNPLPYFPLTPKRLFIQSVLFACLLAAFGGVFMQFYVPPKLAEYTRYPIANCTVLSYYFSQTIHSKTYVVNVSFIDNLGKEHNSTLDMNPLKYEVGDVFQCIYKGNFLQAYSVVLNEVHKANTFWFSGFFVAVFPVVVIYGVILFAMWVKQNKHSSSTQYYNHSFVDSDLVVTDWSTVDAKLQKSLYVLLNAYYNSESETRTTRDVTFSAPKSKRELFAFVIIFFFAVLPVAFFIGAFFTFSGYQFGQYLGGLFTLSVAIAILPTSIYFVRICSTREYVTIVNNELKVTFHYVHFQFQSGCISGHSQPINVNENVV